MILHCQRNGEVMYELEDKDMETIGALHRRDCHIACVYLETTQSWIGSLELSRLPFQFTLAPGLDQELSEEERCFLE